MGTVAMNLVATMMQTSFSSSQYVATSSSTSSETFSGIFNNAKNYSDQLNFNRSKSDYSQPDLSNTVANDSSKLSGAVDRPVNPEPQANEVERSSQLNRDNGDVVNDKDALQTDALEGDAKAKETDGLTAEEALAEEASVLEEEVKAVLGDALNMSGEEVENLLEQLGLTVMDMFDMDNLKLFVSESLGLRSDMDLLTSEGAMEALTEVIEGLKETSANNAELMNQLSEQAGEGEMDFDQLLSDKLENLTGEQSQSGNNPTGGENSGEGEARLLNNQAGQNQSVNASNQASGFEGALNQVVATKTQTIIMNGSVQTIQTEVTAKNVFDQIVTGMKVQVTDTNSKVLLQLNPENLGKIGVNLTNENGTVTGHFIAETEAVKEVIEANLASLKQQLENQGIDVSEIKITVGNTSEFLAGDQDRGNGNGNAKGNQNKKHGIGNINGLNADNIIEDILPDESEIIHENSSIELHA